MTSDEAIEWAIKLLDEGQARYDSLHNRYPDSKVNAAKAYAAIALALQNREERDRELSQKLQTKDQDDTL